MWLRGVPEDYQARSRMCCGGAESDAAQAGGSGETDRRHALTLARLRRSGDLTAVWAPDPEQEAMRDLTRAREDMKGLELKARQRLGAFLLRHDRVYTGKTPQECQELRVLPVQFIFSQVSVHVFLTLFLFA